MRFIEGEIHGDLLRAIHILGSVRVARTLGISRESALSLAIGRARRGTALLAERNWEALERLLETAG